jgi:hypothetical protein
VWQRVLAPIDDNGRVARRATPVVHAAEIGGAFQAFVRAKTKFAHESSCLRFPGGFKYQMFGISVCTGSFLRRTRRAPRRTPQIRPTPRTKTDNAPKPTQRATAARRATCSFWVSGSSWTRGAAAASHTNSEPIRIVRGLARGDGDLPCPHRLSLRADRSEFDCELSFIRRYAGLLFSGSRQHTTEPVVRRVGEGSSRGSLRVHCSHHAPSDEPGSRPHRASSRGA